MPVKKKKKKKVAVPKKVYQIKVTLQGIRPPIWRRLEVTSDTKLSELHDIIQTAMGWQDCHLHQFTVGNTYYGKPDRSSPFDDTKDERKVKLSKLLPKEKSKFAYEYDFGDSWEHEILLEKILPMEEKEYPVCVKGKRACPPEDVGGVWGYANLLKAIQDPDHPEHEEMQEWVEDDFDPEAFDLKDINEYL